MEDRKVNIAELRELLARASAKAMAVDRMLPTLLDRIAQLEAIESAAREEARARTEMLGEVLVGAIGQRHSQLMMAWIHAGDALDDALGSAVKEWRTGK